jgi:hypothetical protein
MITGVTGRAERKAVEWTRREYKCGQGEVEGRGGRDF